VTKIGHSDRKLSLAASLIVIGAAYFAQTDPEVLNVPREEHAALDPEQSQTPKPALFRKGRRLDPLMDTLTISPSEWLHDGHNSGRSEPDPP
jgi:hypothetical protein